MTTIILLFFIFGDATGLKATSVAQFDSFSACLNYVESIDGMAPYMQGRHRCAEVPVSWIGQEI